jgi:hypothetical protein
MTPHDHTNQLLARAVQLLEILIFKESKIMAAIDDLNAAVAAETTVDASVETLLTQLFATITNANAISPAAVAAAVATMQANAAKLTAAVTTNTPPAP